MVVTSLLLSVMCHGTGNGGRLAYVMREVRWISLPCRSSIPPAPLFSSAVPVTGVCVLWVESS